MEKDKLNYHRFLHFLKTYKVYFIFTFIVLVALYLRFWNFEQFYAYTWDQSRDAWKTRDILNGQLVLNGPRTGVGHFFLGPLWFYILAPFYFFTHLDPIGALYANILINIFDFIAFFYVTKKIFNDYAALFATFLVGASQYMIEIMRTPWNVSPVLGVSSLIFYSIYKIIYENNYKWIYLLSFLTGLFFHLHFSFVFLPFIIVLSLIFVKNKKEVIIYFAKSIPLFLIWFLPTILYELQTKNSNSNLFSTFLKEYSIPGFHLKFFLYRIHDSFIQFKTLLHFPSNSLFLLLAIPFVFVVVAFFQKNHREKLFAYLLMVWFVVPIFVYSFYSGSTSEYYVLLTIPMVIYMIIYLQNKLLSFHKIAVLFLLSIFWIWYGFTNTQGYWSQTRKDGLILQKQRVKEVIQQGGVIEFNEGSIESYLYQIWKKTPESKNTHR